MTFCALFSVWLIHLVQAPPPCCCSSLRAASAHGSGGSGDLFRRGAKGYAATGGLDSIFFKKPTKLVLRGGDGSGGGGSNGGRTGVPRTQSRGADGRSSRMDESEEIEEVGDSIPAFQRKVENFFSKEELEQIQRDWEDDSRWSNATFKRGDIDPDLSDSLDPDLVQWEQERLHGDLNQFRRTLEPSDKFTLWHMSQEKKAELERVRKMDATQCADDVSVSLEDEDEDEDDERPAGRNWYVNGRGEIMWRPLNSASYEKYSDDPRFNMPGLQRVPKARILFCDKVDGSKLFKACLDVLIASIISEYKIEVERHGDGAFELEALLRYGNETFKAPDVNDHAAWARWGVYDKDHGISKQRLAVASKPPGTEEQVCDEIPAGSILSSYLSGGEGGGVLRLGGHNYSASSNGKICVVDGGDWFISGHQGSQINGRLRFPSWDHSKGRIMGLRCCFIANDPSVLAQLGELSVVEPCLRIEGGGWSIGWCDVRVAGGQAVRAAVAANVSMFACCIGGLGPLGERAFEGVVAMNVSTAKLIMCTLEACFFGGGRVRHNATLRVERCIVRHCGYGLGCRDQALLHVERCQLSNFTQGGAFMTFDLFVRTARITLLENSLCGKLWVGGIKPRRLFERGTRCVGSHSKSFVSSAVRKALKRARSIAHNGPGVCKRSRTVENLPHDESKEVNTSGTTFSKQTGEGEITSTLKNSATKEHGHPHAYAKCEAGYHEIMGWVKHFFKRGVFVGNISDPDTWDVSEEIKKAAPKQSDAEREKEEQMMKEFFPDAPRVSDIPRLMKKAAKNDVCRLRGGGAYENRVNLGGFSHRGSRGGYGRGGGRGRDMAKRSRNDQPAEEELSDEGPEQSYVPLHPFDRAAHLYVAHLHDEDIRPLHLSLNQRKIEAKFWRVDFDEGINEIFYFKPSTQEARWNLPRGLEYEDLHGNGLSAKFCDLVIPDCLQPNVSTEVDWAAIITLCNSSGNWTEYRQRYADFRSEFRRTILSAKPRSRIYVRMSEPYRFEGEFLCDDPERIHPDTDFKALGENEIGFPIYNLPRLIWMQEPSPENGLGLDFVYRPEFPIWRGVTEDDEDALRAYNIVIEQQRAKEVLNQQRLEHAGRLTKYQWLQKQYSKAKQIQAETTDVSQTGMTGTPAEMPVPWGPGGSGQSANTGQSKHQIRETAIARKMLAEGPGVPDAEDYELEGDFAGLSDEDYSVHKEEGAPMDPKLFSELRGKVYDVMSGYGYRP